MSSGEADCSPCGCTRGRRELEPIGSWAAMSVFHDEVEIEDFEFDEETESYFYPCPCGDKFIISKEDLENGEEVATCPSCSLIIKVIYDKDQFMSGELVGMVTMDKLEKLKC